jgi:non-heme chloroperoxidase
MTPANTLIMHTVAVDDGLKLPCAEHGDRSGLPILLLHGYTDSWRSFELLLPHLPQGLRAIVPTQRGHGDADRPQGYAPADFAGDALAVLNALGIERAIVAGHSMGSQVALRLALDHPERVLGLVLIGGFAALGDNAAVRELWDDAVAGLEDPVDPGFVEAFQRSTMARQIPAEFLDTVVQESLKVLAAVWRDALRAMMEANVVTALRRLAMPTLLLWGDRDAIIPRSEQELLAASLADARLVVLAGTGHAPHWEEHIRVADEISAFARRVTDQKHAAHTPIDRAPLHRSA